MKYFKDTQGNVYAYEADDSDIQYRKPGLIRITKEEAMEIANPPLPPTVPSECSPAQGLIALWNLKRISEVEIEAAMERIEDPDHRYAAKIGYSRANPWKRSSATMQTLASLIGLSDQDLDELFSLAVTIQV